MDLSRFRVRKQVLLDAEPAAVIAHPSEPKVFALTPATGTVYEIDAASLAISRRARAGIRPRGCCSRPRGTLCGCSIAIRRCWRSCRSAPSCPSGMSGSRRLPTASTSAAAGRPRLPASAARTLTLIGMADARIERTVEAGVEPSLVRFQSDGRQLIAGSRPERSLSIFETARGGWWSACRCRSSRAISARSRTAARSSSRAMGWMPSWWSIPTPRDGPDHAGGARPGRDGRHGPAAYLISAGGQPESNGITVLDVGNTGRKLVAVVRWARSPDNPDHAGPAIRAGARTRSRATWR